MNININNLAEFDKIKHIRSEIKGHVEKIKTRKHELKKGYKEYTKNEQEDFFGLDSFQSQIKYMELEFENMYKMYVFLENRIYGDYYRLLSMIYKYIMGGSLKEEQLAKLKEISNYPKYPKYKILNQFEKFDFNIINEIHHDIIMIIHGVTEIIRDNTDKINKNKKQMQLGMKIDNYVNNYIYKNETLKTTNTFYNNYLQVYHKYHYELLKKFYEKTDLMFKHMSNDLNTNQEYHIDKNEIPKRDDEIISIL